MKSDLTENISAYIDTVFNPHMESLPSHVKDTSNFITKIYNLQGIQQTLATLDVTSLYRNVCFPHSDGIKARDHFIS